MPLISPMPASLDPERAVRLLRLEQRGEGAEATRSLLAEAEGLFRPRAFYREAFVEAKTDESAIIDGRMFRSTILRQNLDRAYKVYPYLITVGPELETHAAGLDDPLRRYYLECLADAALEKAAENLRERIVRESGFAVISSLSPGSLENWPITEQVSLFALLGEGAAETGVRLSDSLMMIPRKSISGLFFPSEETFFSCQLCSRVKCPGRKTAFRIRENILEK